MTIKELENRMGMTRANIRFYEGEGLLFPRRLDNGYRNYSEEDAQTLEKIKLLRQLQLDIDTIRKVQQGTLTLEQALFVQATKLEGDKALIERAAAVCRELERSGVEYAALEPRPWLAQLQPQEPPGRLEPPPHNPAQEARDDELQACYHPWMRWLARGLDTALYDTLINVAWLLLFRDQSFIRLQTENVLTITLWSVAMLALTLALEPLWLHFWGWTPGKWLFGLKLRDKDGGKLSIRQGWERSWLLAWEGYGWSIPIYRLWRLWQGRKDALEGWNGTWNGEAACRYTKEERRFGGWAFVGARTALAAALALTGLWSLLPPCRGELTVAEFAQNYDFYFRTLGMDGQYAYEPTLDGEGRWKDAAVVNGSVVVHTQHGISVSSDGQSYSLDDGEDIVWEEPEFTLEDGRVTAVTLRWESCGAYVFPSGTREGLALLAMTGAVDGLNLFNYDLNGWAAMGDRVFGQWGGVEVDHRGLHISQKMEYSGYYSDGTFLLTEEGEVPHCEKTVTISLIE